MASCSWWKMKRRESGYNPKRRIVPVEQWDASKGASFAASVKYAGNAEHKSQPGDYNLTPPSHPRPGKTLCDSKGAFLKKEAQSLLQQGFMRGLVSVQVRGDWPQNVWAVSEAGEVFEAQLENQTTGTYHGYPLPEDDDFRLKVIGEWKRDR